LYQSLHTLSLYTLFAQSYHILTLKKVKIMKISIVMAVTVAALVFAGCSSDSGEKESLTEGGMKCGPGKCGASMMDGNVVLVKKKSNMLEQMRESDSRRGCVIGAESVKELNECVRDSESGRLSIKCGDSEMKNDPQMKCAPGKCG